MKKLFAIIAVAGLLTACNNEEAAKKEAEQKTADSVRAAFVADSIKAATMAPVTTAVDSLKGKMDAATDKIVAAGDSLKAGADKMVDKMKAGADKLKEGADKMKEAVKKN